jgi:hypothetical protein
VQLAESRFVGFEIQYKYGMVQYEYLKTDSVDVAG